MPVIEIKDIPRQMASRSNSDDLLRTEAPIAPSMLRRICLAASNGILQFPAIFEVQQRVLDQPTLLRTEVEKTLHDISDFSEFKVVDYGCGSGTYSGLFAPQNYVGIDCNLAMLKCAQRKHPGHTFIQASNLEGISAQLEGVSHVLLIGVIHHLSEKDLLEILAALSGHRRIRFLSIDTLKCTAGPGRFVQLFERGEFLRTEAEHARLVKRVVDVEEYNRIPYGRYFELAVYRGNIKSHIV